MNTNLAGSDRTDDAADLGVVLRLQIDGLTLMVPAKRPKNERIVK